MEKEKREEEDKGERMGGKRKIREKERKHGNILETCYPHSLYCIRMLTSNCDSSRTLPAVSTAIRTLPSFRSVLRMLAEEEEEEGVREKGGRERGREG